MLPTASDVHVDQLLTNISTAYINDSYIADQIFPIVGVQKQSNKLVAYNQSAWFRNEAAIRTPGTEPKVGEYDVDTSATYFCDQYAIGRDIPDEVRENADMPFNLDREATMYVTDKLQMLREVKFATDFFAASVWGTDKTGGADFTVWSNYGGSSPLTDVESFKDTVNGKIAKDPNTFVIGKQVELQLKWHPDIMDVFKYTQTPLIGNDKLKAVFGFDRVLVGRALYTTDKEGTAEGSVTYTRVWGKHGLMLYVPSGPSLMEPAAGYTFVWRSIPGADQAIYRFRDEKRRKDTIYGYANFDQKATATAAGLFVSGAVA
jgi:hypothetical protein